MELDTWIKTFRKELHTFTIKTLFLDQEKKSFLLGEEDMKSLKSKIRPCLWAMCTQLCFVNDLHYKLPMGPLGAAPCGATGNMGMILGLDPRLPGK